jgi:uncharacterized protein with PIN domain
LRFVADGMLGRFSRWLRIIGCDVKYFNDASDDSLLSLAEAEERVLLTRDLDLYQRAGSRKVSAFFIGGESEAEQLACVARCYDISLEVDMSASRCPVCGGYLNQVETEKVLEKVPSGTLKHYDEFWLCSGCGKVYWKGSHWKKINETLDKAKALEARIIN